MTWTEREKDSFPNFCKFVFYQYDLQILSLPVLGSLPCKEAAACQHCVELGCRLPVPYQ